MAVSVRRRFRVFFFNDTATTEIYTLSLHDALPIYRRRGEFSLGVDHRDPTGGNHAASDYTAGDYTASDYAASDYTASDYTACDYTAFRAAVAHHRLARERECPRI